jgi:KamA family protein
LLQWLRELPWPVAIVLHANHGNEIDDSVRAACASLRAAGATLLNQAVLLRGVNDSVAALSDLSQRLFAAGVVPYYLYLLDRVRGAAHFEVPEATAQQLLGKLASTLSGYLVPRLVREVPGAPAKISVAPQFAPWIM